jgi:hypothetical protein
VKTVDLIAIGLLALQAGFVLMMVVYLISGLDDLFFDLLFFASKIAERFAGNFDRRPASLELPKVCRRRNEARTRKG